MIFICILKGNPLGFPFSSFYNTGQDLSKEWMAGQVHTEPLAQMDVRELGFKDALLPILDHIPPHP